MLVAGFISAVLGNRLPWPGTIYVKQELRFLSPVETCGVGAHEAVGTKTLIVDFGL
jgi:hypothetical protein